ncbi:hypothetical protein SAMN02746089_02708 [Caldanaerobius fijiensis DSM 17918]|uniref:Uncharacterized protein n=1 Tax=Caldanaerobius fijiensis DSM 17918 TaxID=1121256 RepID=A0A1M5FA55_9THEO|nr:hypothetical protein [Caldanaerobius fijiensis]SHF87951.1 hypothetical protein SAMN02746089_02708 [Caldanaerobius fijiensis DSM 17918]
MMLTERDMKLLEHLKRYGVITKEGAGALYGTEKYHDTRLTELYRAGYVKRKYGIVYLGKKGKEVVGEGKKLPTDKMMKRRAIRISEMAAYFEGSAWTFVPSWEVKRREGEIDRGGRFLGLLEGRTEYMVYDVGEKPNEVTIKRMKDEMRKLYKVGVYRAVVFYGSGEAREKYGTEGLGLTEQLALPYPEGIELLRKHGERDIVKEAARKAFGEVREPEWSEADCTAEGKQVVVLVLNDIEKRAKLKNYFELAKYRHTKVQEVIIVCLKEQEETFRKEYPMCEIRTVEI